MYAAMSTASMKLDVVGEKPIRSGAVAITASALASTPRGAKGPRQSSTCVVWPCLSSQAASCRMPIGAMRLASTVKSA